MPFTIAARRAGSLIYRRAFVYHACLALITVTGVLRAAQGERPQDEALLAGGVMVLLARALSNSWQLVLSHQINDEAQPTGDRSEPDEGS